METHKTKTCQPFENPATAYAMTEQEYINVRDLSNVLTADRALREMNSSHNGIDEVEYQYVLEKLNSWRETLFSKINIPKE